MGSRRKKGGGGRLTPSESGSNEWARSATSGAVELAGQIGRARRASTRWSSRVQRRGARRVVMGSSSWACRRTWWESHRVPGRPGPRHIARTMSGHHPLRSGHRGQTIHLLDGYRAGRRGRRRGASRHRDSLPKRGARPRTPPCLAGLLDTPGWILCGASACFIHTAEFQPSVQGRFPGRRGARATHSPAAVPEPPWSAAISTGSASTTHRDAVLPRRHPRPGRLRLAVAGIAARPATDGDRADPGFQRWPRRVPALFTPGGGWSAPAGRARPAVGHSSAAPSQSPAPSCAPDGGAWRFSRTVPLSAAPVRSLAHGAARRRSPRPFSPRLARCAGPLLRRARLRRDGASSPRRRAHRRAGRRLSSTLRLSGHFITRLRVPDGAGP